MASPVQLCECQKMALLKKKMLTSSGRWGLRNRVTAWKAEVSWVSAPSHFPGGTAVPLTSVSQVTLGAGLPSAVQEAASVRPWPSSRGGPGFSEGKGGTADKGRRRSSSQPRLGGPTPSQFSLVFSSFILSTEMSNKW